MLIKLQSPLIDKNGNQVYPLTTYDQVILPDNSRWDGSLLQGPAGPAGPAGNVSMTHISNTYEVGSGPTALLLLIKVGGAYVSPNDYFIIVSAGILNELQAMQATPWVSPEGRLGVIVVNFWQPEAGVRDVTVHVGVGRYDGATFGSTEIEEWIG